MYGESRKIVGIVVYLVYYNICLYVAASAVYWNNITLSIILLDQFFFAADALTRPATVRERIDTTTKLVGLFILLHPFIPVLLFYENMFLTAVYIPLLDIPVVVYIGIAVLVIGGIIAVISRVQLGRYGGGTIDIKESHELITTGLYNRVRHPLYTGGLLGRIGLGLAFRGYLVTIIVVIGYFLLFRRRMEIEEQILTEEFGEDYQLYLKRTKRLVPFFY